MATVFLDDLIFLNKTGNLNGVIFTEPYIYDSVPFIVSIVGNKSLEVTIVLNDKIDRWKKYKNFIKQFLTHIKTIYFLRTKYLIIKVIYSYEIDHSCTLGRIVLLLLI